MAAASVVLLFDNPAGQVLADPAGFLRAHWATGPRTLADTQALFVHIALALAQRGWSKVLVDQATMRPFSAAEQEWVAQQWLPQAVTESGYCYGAVVVSLDTYTRLATAYITTNVQGLPLRYRSFDSVEAAEAWLRQQPG